MEINSNMANRLYKIKPYSDILALIRDGKENGVHLQKLINFTGLKNRDVRKCIEYIRRNGIVIISGDYGYYFPSTSSELSTYIQQERSRANSIHETLQTAERAYDQMIGGVD